MSNSPTNPSQLAQALASRPALIEIECDDGDPPVITAFEERATVEG